MSEGNSRVIPARWGILALGFCLLAGCTPRRPATDLYVDAVALRELGQNELAISKLNAVIAADPDFALAYTELGKAHEALGDRAKALTAFEKAAKLAPWSAQDHLNLAKIHDLLGNYGPAAEAYARAAELDSKSAEALTGAARCYLKAGQYAKSQMFCELAEKAGVKPGETLFLLAQACESQKDYERAVEVYRRLLALDGDDPNVLRSLGVTYLKAGQYDRAREVLVLVARKRPEDGAAFRDLGYCFAKLGDIDQAMQMYQKAVDLDGKDWEACRGLGVAMMLKARQTQDVDLETEAVRQWRRSLLLRPDQPKREALEKLIREHSRLQNSLEGLNY